MQIWELIPDWVFQAAYAVLALGVFCAFVRMVRGPSLPDRIVALDLISAIVMCFAAVHAVDTGQTHYLDAALAIAVIAFIGTIAFARFMEKRKGDPEA
ncbi:MAG: cation:proton antiporter [Verrucomicrobiota bacterium]